jgi:polyisoprenyl-phosphate glycosyltransferase
VRPERPYGNTTNSLVRNLGWARKAILSFSYTPLDLIMWLALATVGISVLGIVVQVALRIADPASVRSGITTLLVVVLFIGGVQLLCLSIIGSYLAHIYDEVKRRPAYIVESVINDPRPAQRDATGAPESPAAAGS